MMEEEQVHSKRKTLISFVMNENPIVKCLIDNHLMKFNIQNQVPNIISQASRDSKETKMNHINIKDLNNKI